MTISTTKLTSAVEKYFTDLRQIRATGGGTGERSSYGPLANLLNAVGKTLKPTVFCVSELADQGAGHPDFGLYTAKQVQKGRPRQGQTPERGVVEVKPPAEELGADGVRDQVGRYLKRYHLVLATNLREFTLVGLDTAGREVVLEWYPLARTEEEFNHGLETPRAFAREIGAGLCEYLIRALSHQAAITEPKDLAWLLASYARDGLARFDAGADAPSLKQLRFALEESLGVQFEKERGTRFFHSTLVQTLFYGIFSAWVLWSREGGQQTEEFNWKTSHWRLRTPIMSALFGQIAQPSRLKPLGLDEILNLANSALNRVEPDAFFARFDEGEAVTYFYEPFLEAFDPDLRKQLGVWYTPSEVVRYMVARVDKALKEDLGIADGLAAENVYVLDPCCGTGAYVAEVLRRIAANLEGRGLGVLAGARIKQAATERVFGFEIMPAPFVVAHLQIDLVLRDLDAALADDGNERPGIFLTNALTGWDKKSDNPLAFPELEEERRQAGRVKFDTPILVILGNPPYNGFAGVAIEEEHKLLEAYRKPINVNLIDSRALNDLYVRFFRVAERRITEKTGHGVVCFISNYSWLDGLSFSGMRERYLDAFDAIRIDCLNGDKYRTGKVSPDGLPDPSIFSTDGDPVGIQVGTAITTLVRKANHAPAESVEFRQLWGMAKPLELIQTAEVEPHVLYDRIEPILPLGLPFSPMAVSTDWFDWPALPELVPVSFPGVHTGRDRLLVGIDEDQLRKRVADYFNPALSHEEIRRRCPAAMRDSSAFKISDARATREALLSRGGPHDSGFIRVTYRPFDNRWLYWEADRRLLTAPAPDYKRHAIDGNRWLSSAKRLRKDGSEPQAFLTTHVGSFHLIESGAAMFPAYLRDDGLRLGSYGLRRRPNLSATAEVYTERLGIHVEDIFHHILAVLHDPTYRQTNADALRMGWPRIPLPCWPDGKAEGAAQALAESAVRGHELASHFDPDAAVPGVTESPLRPEIAAIAVPSRIDGRNMSGDDFALTAGWGHFGAGEAVMPGQGRVEQREYTAHEIQALAAARSVLGDSTFDIYLNDKAYWRDVPTAIWNYKLGGYQVLKKWLSYRERKVLGRALKPEEVAYFAEVARRIAAILVLTARTDLHE